MKFLLSLALITGSLNLLAAEHIFLGDVMSKKEQKIIGIDKLTVAQKIELERWMNQTFVLKEQKESQTDKESLSLSINIDNGHRLELSDNSIWEIAPDDVIKSSAWITPFPVTVTPSNDPAYPYLITNTVSKNSVKAKRWVEPKPIPQPKNTPPPSIQAPAPNTSKNG